MALDFSNVMTGHYGQMIIDGTSSSLWNWRWVHGCWPCLLRWCW